MQLAYFFIWNGGVDEAVGWVVGQREKLHIERLSLWRAGCRGKKTRGISHEPVLHGPAACGDEVFICEG